MRPVPQTDGHDFPRSLREFFPSFTAEGDDLLVVCEDAVREPVIAHVLPDVFDGIEFG